MKKTAVSHIEDHIGYWLNRLRSEVHGGFERALLVHEVSVAQWSVLSVLYHREADNVIDVARYLGIDGAAVTRLAQRLEAKGLLRRVRGSDDRRVVRLLLTPKGTRLLPLLAKAADDNDRAFFATINEEEELLLRQLIGKLLSARGIGPLARMKVKG